jgi:hypothetical protein
MVTSALLPRVTQERRWQNRREQTNISLIGLVGCRVASKASRSRAWSVRLGRLDVLTARSRHDDKLVFVAVDQPQKGVQELADNISMAVGFDERVACVCHGDLLSGNQNVTQGDHVRADPASAGHLARSLSSGL